MLYIKIKKDIEKSRAVLLSMLMLIRSQTEHLKEDDITGLLWNEKDSLLSAHTRVIQLQVKLAESALRFKQEELKLERMEKELLNREELLDDSEEQFPPLVEEEWDALFHALERNKSGQKNARTNTRGEREEGNNYAVLLK